MVVMSIFLFTLMKFMILYQDLHKKSGQPNFLIVEGINVFQNPINQRLYMSDYFDFSLYIDAEVNNIESWYLERFQTLLELAKKMKTTTTIVSLNLARMKLYL